MIALPGTSATGRRTDGLEACRSRPPAVDVRVVHESGGALRVVLAGELDFATARHVLAAVDELGAAPAKQVFDLSGVDFIDCAGVSLLRALQARGDDDGCSVVFDRRLSRAVARVLDLTHQRAALRWSA